MSQIIQPLKQLHHVARTRQDALGITSAKSLLEHYDRASARFWQALSACALCLIALALICSLFGCDHHARPTLPVADPPRTADQQDAAAVRIEVACVSGDAFIGQFNLTGAYGSGAIISDSNVLTANHVVRCEGVTIINVVTVDGRKWPATVAFTDSSRDYARLNVPGLKTPLRASFAAPQIDDTICLVTAFPKRIRSCGKIVNIHPYSTMDNGTVDIEFDAPIVSGNSGSGIYNERGDLIGLATNSRGILIGGLGTSIVGRVK